MLNRAARYFPIIRVLREFTGEQDRILEVGSGPQGIVEFWSRPVVGCDVEFTETPNQWLRPLICSGVHLPFGDAHFDAVVVSDVLEHVPPEFRRSVVAEALRVTRRVAIFGYPCGEVARMCDRRLRDIYVARRLSPPTWLEEHMLYPFPDETLWSNAVPGWRVRTAPNEKLGFHRWMMRMEMHGKLCAVFRKALQLMPAVFEPMLRLADGEPSYRKIFILTPDCDRPRV